MQIRWKALFSSVDTHSAPGGYTLTPFPGAMFHHSAQVALSPPKQNPSYGLDKRLAQTRICKCPAHFRLLSNFVSHWNVIAVERRQYYWVTCSLSLVRPCRVRVLRPSLLNSWCLVDCWLVSTQVHDSSVHLSCLLLLSTSQTALAGHNGTHQVS
jgi:hypothetical protein